MSINQKMIITRHPKKYFCIQIFTLERMVNAYILFNSLSNKPFFNDVFEIDHRNALFA